MAPIAVIKYWLSRDKRVEPEFINVWRGQKPIKQDGIYWAGGGFEDVNSYFLFKLDVEDFEAMSGWKIAPGHCKRIKLKFVQKKRSS